MDNFNFKKKDVSKAKINANIVKSHNYLSKLLVGKNPDGSNRFKYTYNQVDVHSDGQKKFSKKK